MSFLRRLLAGTELSETKFEALRVVDMSDGGMGSLLFVSKDGELERQLGRVLVQAEFQDRDGVLVSAAVNLDTGRELYELDLWKVDFSKLIEFPKPNQVRIKDLP